MSPSDILIGGIGKTRYRYDSGTLGSRPYLTRNDLRSTHVLKLELETLDYKLAQLLPIVERLKQLESREVDTHIVYGHPVCTKFVLHGEPDVYKWSGPSNFENQNFGPV